MENDNKYLRKIHKELIKEGIVPKTSNDKEYKKEVKRRLEEKRKKYNENK